MFCYRIMCCATKIFSKHDFDTKRKTSTRISCILYQFLNTPWFCSLLCLYVVSMTLVIRCLNILTYTRESLCTVMFNLYISLFSHLVNIYGSSLNVLINLILALNTTYTINILWILQENRRTFESFTRLLWNLTHHPFPFSELRIQTSGFRRSPTLPQKRRTASLTSSTFFLRSTDTTFYPRCWWYRH